MVKRRPGQRQLAAKIGPGEGGSLGNRLRGERAAGGDGLPCVAAGGNAARSQRQVAGDLEAAGVVGDELAPGLQRGAGIAFAAEIALAQGQRFGGRQCQAAATGAGRFDRRKIDGVGVRQTDIACIHFRRTARHARIAAADDAGGLDVERIEVGADRLRAINVERGIALQAQGIDRRQAGKAGIVERQSLRAGWHIAEADAVRAQCQRLDNIPAIRVFAECSSKAVVPGCIKRHSCSGQRRAGQHLQIAFAACRGAARQLPQPLAGKAQQSAVASHLQILSCSRDASGLQLGILFNSELIGRGDDQIGRNQRRPGIVHHHVTRTHHQRRTRCIALADTAQRETFSAKPIQIADAKLHEPGIGAGIAQERITHHGQLVGGNIHLSTAMNSSVAGVERPI